MIEIKSLDPWTDQLWTYDKELYCPYCGQHTVYIEREDDYYVGQQHLCVACSEAFYLPAGGYDVRRRDKALTILKEHHDKSDA